MTERADRRFLVKILRQAFEYFAHEADEDSGLVLDKTKGEFASIAAVGFGLSVYPIGVERGYWSRKKAIARTLAALRFFRESAQGKERDATGYKGFYYHFLDMTSGRRAARSELSTIDTAILIAGALMAATYFDRANADEREIRRSAEDLFARVDWRWMLDPHKLLRHGWKPESGFIPYVWSGYNEAHVLYLLGLASPSSPLPKASYRAWTNTFEWRTVFGQSYFYAAPLFIHQLSQTWFDLRSIRDAATRRRKLSYFENSRRATYAQQAYAIRNPGRFEHYGERAWGLTASDGPGPSVRTIGGRRIRFFDYVARGIPEGPDDGTLAPWSVVSSLPFAPEIVIPTARHFEEVHLRERRPYGFRATFNATYPHAKGVGWVSPHHFALNEGPVVMMIENHLSGLCWELGRRCVSFKRALERGGFA